MQKSTNLESALRPFLPEGSVDLVCEKLRAYPHHLVITPPRSTKLGDFKADSRTGKMELTVNGNLNPFAFLVTLMHELAHLITHIEHGWNVKPHGTEWKSAFIMMRGCHSHGIKRLMLKTGRVVSSAAQSIWRRLGWLQIAAMWRFTDINRQTCGLRRRRGAGGR